LFSSWSNSANQLGRSGQIQANDQADPSLSFSTGGVLADIDVSQQRDFAFSLSNVQLANGNRVPVTANGISTVPWSAEGSFSASAIPAPGALALAGLGMIATARRRRN
jgi:MYXO-CTERM domain-containing protein